ncbi:histidine phosphatase superfamily [Pseudoneurospora amorphoporcata]|uniref:Histidine phosphatase superfamily n=1 Tax=Pseudoneurospora amorphoporcata TaxID=241081 RepID=A0AAN6P784_9PEZI|nr:histidine phosphatase superfamily [Pseudoneurospora amorphoporcata]
MSQKTIIYLVRHAQGHHNLCAANHALPDPSLTPLGESQCFALRDSFPHHDKITHLVASPMRRTLYTCLLSFQPVVERLRVAHQGEKKRGVVVALPEVQEVSNLPCDVGSAPEKLHEEFDAQGGLVDLELVKEGWQDKESPESPWRPDMEKLKARAEKARRWLFELARQGSPSSARSQADGVGEEKEQHIVVVTHGGFLHFLTQDFDGMDLNKGTGWENTEWRSYELVAEAEGVRLKETDESWRKRKGDAKPLTETEQLELIAAVDDRLRQEFGDGVRRVGGKREGGERIDV